MKGRATHARAKLSPVRTIRPSSGSGARIRDLAREQGLLLALLTVVALAPLALVALYVSRHGGVLTGVNGGDYYDQFQYLAWTRDAGANGLASNLWVIGSTPHDYLQPMYLISGFLWRIGLGFQLAYLIWKPVAILMVFLGFAAYVQHMVDGGRLARGRSLGARAVLRDPLLAHCRLAALALAGARLSAAVSPSTIPPPTCSSGASSTSRSRSRWPRCSSSPARRPSPPPGTARRWLLTASAAGTIAAWLHPWQAVMVLGALAGMFVLRGPRRRYLQLCDPGRGDAGAADSTRSFCPAPTPRGVGSSTVWPPSDGRPGGHSSRRSGRSCCSRPSGCGARSGTAT